MKSIEMKTISIVGLFVLKMSLVMAHVVPLSTSTEENQENVPISQKLFAYYADVKAIKTDSFLSEPLYCGGAIIAVTWIITDPRCCQSDYVTRVFVNTTEHCRGNEVGVTECEVDDGKGIALIKTVPMKLTNDVRIIRLPRKTNPHLVLRDERVFLAGREYKATDFHDFDHGLKETDLAISFNAKCSGLDLERVYCFPFQSENNNNIAYPGSPLIVRSDEGLLLVGIFKYQADVLVFEKISNYEDLLQLKSGVLLN